jgi:hypothetical protein
MKHLLLTFASCLPVDGYPREAGQPVEDLQYPERSGHGARRHENCTRNHLDSRGSSLPQRRLQEHRRQDLAGPPARESLALPQDPLPRLRDPRPRHLDTHLRLAQPVRPPMKGLSVLKCPPKLHTWFGRAKCHSRKVVTRGSGSCSL